VAVGHRDSTALRRGYQIITGLWAALAWTYKELLAGQVAGQVPVLETITAQAASRLKGSAVVIQQPALVAAVGGQLPSAQTAQRDQQRVPVARAQVVL